MATKFWEMQERQSFILRDKDVQLLADIAKYKMLVISGSPASGKSTIEEKLLERGLVYTVKKAATRKVKLNEKNKTIRFRSLRLKDLFRFERIPRLETVNVGISPPYEEWKYWASEFHIKAPNRRDLIRELNQTIALFLLEDVLADCESAKALGKVPVLGLFPQDAVTWKRLFPLTKIVHLSVTTEELMRRTSHDRNMKLAVTRARLLDALSTPKRLKKGNLVLPNNTPEDLNRNIEIISDYIQRGILKRHLPGSRTKTLK